MGVALVPVTTTQDGKYWSPTVPTPMQVLHTQPALLLLQGLYDQLAISYKLSMSTKLAPIYGVFYPEVHTSFLSAIVTEILTGLVEEGLSLDWQ